MHCEVVWFSTEVPLHFVVESPGNKRPSPAGPYVDEGSGCPPASKRRHCDNRSSVANVANSSVVGLNVGPAIEPAAGQPSGPVVRGGVISGPGPVLSPVGGMSPSNRSASPPQVRFRF